MSKKEKPLPKPPTKAFGRKNNFEQPDEQSSLLADRMAAAAAEGKLDEFLKQEMPDNDYARNLASMMMGMTGMAGGERTSLSEKRGQQHGEQGPEEKEKPAADVPDDVRTAILGGDVQNVMELLRREHQKRNPDAEIETPVERVEPSSPADKPVIDQEIINALVQIASDNSVTLDWIILRAIKQYVQEYQKTGKL